MSRRNLTIYYSKEELSERIYDYSNVYLLPSICLFGMATSGLSIIVSFKKSLNENILKYIFINSLADFSFLLTQFFLLIIRCGTLCPYGYSYWANIYEIYVYWFLGYTIICFKVLVDISVSIERLFFAI